MFNENRSKQSQSRINHCTFLRNTQVFLSESFEWIIHLLILTCHWSAITIYDLHCHCKTHIACLLWQLFPSLKAFLFVLQVTVENFLRVLTGRLPTSTPRSKRLLSDDRSNILIYLTGQTGNGVIAGCFFIFLLFPESVTLLFHRSWWKRLPEVPGLWGNQQHGAGWCIWADVAKEEVIIQWKCSNSHIFGMISSLYTHYIYTLYTWRGQAWCWLVVKDLGW